MSAEGLHLADARDELIAEADDDAEAAAEPKMGPQIESRRSKRVRRERDVLDL